MAATSRRGVLLLAALQRVAAAPGGGAAIAGSRKMLVQRALMAAAERDLARLPRRLDATPYDSATSASTVRHNGTGLERIVNATWQCTYPEGKCFSNHAPLEGLPDKVENCVKEKVINPLQVEMTIDLHCANFDNQIHCDRTLYQGKFDPLYLCNNDPLLIKAECHVQCTKGYPYEICIFSFDTEKKFNLTDDTIEECHLEATCMSPYVEQNQMFCAGKTWTSKFVPHWHHRKEPPRDQATHGLRAPALKEELKTVGRAVLWLWFVGFIAMLMAGVVGVRKGYLPHPQEWVERFRELADSARNVTRIGVPYRAPSVPNYELPGWRLSSYKAPDTPAHANANARQVDHDLQPLQREEGTADGLEDEEG